MISNSEISGRVRMVVKDSEGNIKRDTGEFSNIILNQGLEFFGGNKGTKPMYDYCIVGAGNSTPVVTQTLLDSPIKIVQGVVSKYTEAELPDVDGHISKEVEILYKFSGLGSVNISEVGLCTQYTQLSFYYLCTRALIKDEFGAPTSISVSGTDILEVYYTLSLKQSVVDKVQVVSITDGAGETADYNVTIRAAKIGTGARKVGEEFSRATGVFNSNNGSGDVYTGVLGDVTGEPTGKTSKQASMTLDNYVPNSYERTFSLTYGTATGNITTRGISFATTMGHYQMSILKVSDGSPLQKRDTDSLKIPFTITWGSGE